MGGKGSGRKPGTKFGHYYVKPSPSKQLDKLKQVDLTEVGHNIEKSASRYRHYAYNKEGKKYHSLINKNNPADSFRAIPQEQYEAHLIRLAKGTDAYEKLWIYGKEGTQWRAENARSGLVTRLQKQFPGQSFVLNGKRYSFTDVLFKLDKLKNTAKWLEIAERNKEMIGDYFEHKYVSEVESAPSWDAGTKMLETDEIDTDVRNQNGEEYKQSLKDMTKLLERLFK